MKSSDTTTERSSYRFDDDDDDLDSLDYEVDLASSDDDRASSVTSNSSRSTTNTTTDGAAASNEERQVTGARNLFLLVLFLAAGALCGVVYWVTKEEEIEDYNTQFENLGFEVIEASNENVRKAFQALETLSVTITAFIKEQKDNGYPAGFIKIPDTEYHLTKTQENAGAYVVGYMPHVEKKDYYKWSEFSLANQDWIAEANAAHGIDDPRFHDNTTLFYPFLHDYEFYNDGGAQVEVPFDVATCAKTESEQEVNISELTDTITTTKRVVSDPVNYTDPFYVPVWQLTPAPHPDYGLGLGNFNLVGDPIFAQILEIINKTRATTFFDVCKGSKWFNPANFAEDGVFSLIISPVFDDHGENSTIVGTLSAVVTWRVFFEDILVKGSEPVDAVMKNKCGGKEFVYHIDGSEATFIGDDANHRSESMKLDAPFAEFAYSDEYLAAGGDSCTYTIQVYPTKEFEAAFSSQEPLYYALVVLAVFFFTSLSFFAFDWLVQRRQKDLVSIAARQNALVASLFPKNVHKKLLAEADEAAKQKRSTIGRAGLRKFLNDTGSEIAPVDGESSNKSKPIADLFPETTIMFADIAGFTAWSSTREPSQVFMLLESIYHEFDVIAKRRGVFKVETIGDCYVAVCGLPDPRREHATTMSRFANDCMKTMHHTTERLERELGPDTADLGLRVGLHSGPVVAGVLRGEKSRFQLFGDTMNTASRMESTGVANKIQISQDTADALDKAGKAHWFVAREDSIKAKGKGELNTFWLVIKANLNASGACLNEDFLDGSERTRITKQDARIAKWTVEVLSTLLKEIISSRKARGVSSDPLQRMVQLERGYRNSPNPLQEVEEIIMLPEYNAKKFAVQDASDMVLDDKVATELHDFVEVIAGLYNNNAFHNFQHANHVTQSVSKLLNRIVAPDLDECSDKTLHDHTYGITSDPLTRFAVLFAALIHDVDHAGVPNGQLVKEGAPVSVLYDQKSVAEQNSVDICWDLLMEPTYENLRRAIYTNEPEFKRFRKLVVNTVMATDIMDKDLKQLRNNRWDAAFNASCNPLDDDRRAINRKATIVIEHLIQASDVAHTMQHWHIYRKWNELFFMECYQAYEDGRAENDPSTTWYEGEKGFFDFYIIPLAKKLKECGVFGVSSDEYLSYALQNRKEWEERGQGLVEDMVKTVHRRRVSKKILEVSQH